MPVVLPWPSTDTLQQVRVHLAAGECVVLPSESTYELVASALHPGALERLGAAGDARGNAAIILGSLAESHDWFPLLKGAAARFLRKHGAGAYVLRADAGFRAGLVAKLSTAAKGLVIRDEKLAIRWPDHSLWSELQPLCLPLVARPLAGALDAEQAQRIVSDRAACIVDGGGQVTGQPGTVLSSDGRTCRIERPGMLTAEQIDELTCCHILFVCTGNTCRSPMAESLCVKLLADRLGCLPAELTQRGFCVQSAGLAAMMGAEASREAIEVANEFGADLRQHRSRMASIDMLRRADFVFAMTAGHWVPLRNLRVPGLPAPRMLSPLLEDIGDPIGGTLADYRACANQIMECLQAWLPELLES